MSIETALKDAEEEIRSILKDIGNHVHTPKRLVAVFHKLLVEFHLEHSAPTAPVAPAAAPAPVDPPSTSTP
ncbi:MAG: hypothetical protein KGL35_04240 [Bradyrhizobium sp.]|nr:hypothetical protein [Bradyrhizobium sp.]